MEEKNGQKREINGRKGEIRRETKGDRKWRENGKKNGEKMERT